MTYSSSGRRRAVSLLIALAVHAIVVSLVMTQWQWPETLEPLQDVTPMMTLITRVPEPEKAASLPELSSPAPMQKKSMLTQNPTPAAPRKATADRKAHKAVAAKPQPSVPASSSDQMAVALPSALQLPESSSSVASTSQQQANHEQMLQSPSLSASALKDIAAAYRAMVHGRIAVLQQYPTLAKRMGEEGTVLVRFTILASGTISHVVIMESSGSEGLDAAAVDIFMKGLNGHLPPIPPELNKNEWTLSLPIRYQLQ